MPKIKPVHVFMDSNYFDKIFEPARRNVEKKLGVSISQTKFTALLAKSKIKIRMPKIKNPKTKFKQKMRLTI